MLSMPTLETARTEIRPFNMADLDSIHQILDVELADADFGTDGPQALNERRQWLQWSVFNYDALAKLYQPPYGDRAVVRKEDGQLIGAVGFVPYMNHFGQLPGFGSGTGAGPALASPEFGLYWAVSPRYQRQGYASEAGRALIDYAFTQLRVARIVATTDYDNPASIGVMRKLGMTILTNPYPDPPWLQVAGVLENPIPPHGEG